MLICMYVCMSVCMYVHTCMYVYMYVCMYVCMYVHICMYIINFSFHIGSKEDVGKRDIVRTIGTASFGRSL